MLEALLDLQKIKNDLKKKGIKIEIRIKSNSTLRADNALKEIVDVVGGEISIQPMNLDRINE